MKTTANVTNTAAAIDTIWNDLYDRVQSGRLSSELYEQAHEAYGLEARGQIMEALAVASDVIAKANLEELLDLLNNFGEAGLETEADALEALRAFQPQGEQAVELKNAFFDAFPWFNGEPFEKFDQLLEAAGGSTERWNW